MKVLTRFSVCIVALTLLACTTPGELPQAPLIPNDTTITTGVLDNGLTYYIKQNDKPAAKAELRLIINAGSVLENDNQLGLAHFLEHMAFNGTDAYPKNELVSFLQDVGMEFGPDVNAYTSFDETVYMLSLPADDAEVLRQGMEVLAQWAFHMTITDADVEEERGVILEEWRLGRGAGQRLLDKALPVLLGDSDYASRLPIGDPEIIQHADPQLLRDFYRDWYRPDLMAVVAVGDFDEEMVGDLIHEYFDDAETADDSAPARGQTSVPVKQGGDFLFESDPEETVAAVEILNRYTPEDSNSIEGYREIVLDNLFYAMINQRLYELLQRSNQPFVSANAYQTNYVRGVFHSGISVLTAPEDLQEALASIFVEYERIGRYGFLESELLRAKENLSSSVESIWKDRDNVPHNYYISSIQDNFLSGTPMPDLDWEWKQIQTLLPGITTDDFNERIYSRLLDENSLILISGPDEIEAARFDAADARAIRAEVKQMVIDPWEDRSASQPLVEAPPIPGRIVAESTDEASGIIQWQLSNGAQVYLLPTDFKNDQVLYGAFSAGGLSLVGDDAYMSGALASTIVQVSGLGDFSAVDLDKELTGIQASVSPYLREYSEGLSGSASPEDLETMLKLQYLYFTGTRLDEAAWGSYEGRLSEYLKNQEREPRVQYQHRLNEALFAGHPRAKSITAADIDRVNSGEALAIFQERFADASDFRYVLVGAFEPEDIREDIEMWIGGLPADTASAPEMAADNGRDYFSGTIREEVKAGIEPLAIVTLAWTGEADWSYDALYDMAALSSALDIVLIEEIREKAGATYSISASGDISALPDEEYRILIQFSCEPSRVDEIIGLVHDVIDDFRNNGPGEEYAAKVSEAQRLNYRENLEKNEWWMNQIQFLLEMNLDWSYALEKTNWYNALTSAQLQESAARWFNDSNYGEILLLPAEN